MVIKVSVPDRFQFKMVPTFKNMMMFKAGGRTLYRGEVMCCLRRWEQKKKQGQLRDWERGNDQLAKSQLIEHNLRLVVIHCEKNLIIRV